MKLFDSHCHLNDSIYKKDFEQMLKRMDEARVKALMIVGITKENSASALALAEAHNGFYASAGVHPHYAESCSEESLMFLKGLAQNPKVRAWGETGLDFNRMHSPREDQEKWFIRQLEAADEMELPLIFHERDSQGRFLEILKAFNSKRRKGVIHCFSGDRSEMEAYLNMGFYIGITGIITIKGRGAQLREMAPDIPLEKILVETDAPYLTPTPQRNKYRRNEPAFVRTTLLKLAEVRGEDPEFLAEAVWKNTCQLFNLPA